jgi:hypothetical protein
MGDSVINIGQLGELADATNIDKFAPESTDAFTTSEEETELPGLERSEGGADPVEPQEIFEVSDVEPADLDHYLDGRQRTFMLGHVEGRHNAFLPVQLHLSGGVTVTAGRDIYHGPRTRMSVLVPALDRLPPRMRRKIQSADFDVVETLEDRDPENDYQKLRKIGVERSSNERDRLEQNMVRDFSEDTLLCKDGTVPEPTEFVVEKDYVVGVVKNHYKRYLDFEDDQVMFGMNVGERTWLFEVERSGNPLLSCYLRIRQVDEDPRTGVVRVEVHPDREHQIDHICRRILDESYPLKRNVPSWQNQIYPFTVAEKAVDAHMPGRDVILSSLKGLGIIT